MLRRSWSFTDRALYLSISIPRHHRPSPRQLATLRQLQSPDQSKFLDDFNKTHEIPQQSIDHFSSTPWTRNILQNDVYEMKPFYSRYLMQHTGENRFFAQTVNTDSTVPHVLGLVRRDLQTPPSSTEADELEPKIDLSTTPDVVCLLSLGRDLEAHPGIVNGGFQAVIFDEVIYQLLLVHQHNVAKPGPRDKHYTLSIATRYTAPVKAPSDVLVRASLVFRKGRKWFTRAEIVDCDGQVLTSAESWWLTARKPIS